MKRTLVWLAIAGVMLLAYAIYRLRGPKNDLNVEPHAREEIEKAQRR